MKIFFLSQVSQKLMQNYAEHDIWEKKLYTPSEFFTEVDLKTCLREGRIGVFLLVMNKL